MSLSPEMVQKVSRLARLKFSAQGLAHMQTQLEGILHWIDQLQNVSGPLEKEEAFLIDSRERTDTVCQGNLRDLLLENAPEKKHGMFSVPKVIE